MHFILVEVSAFYHGVLLTPQIYSPTNGDLSIQLQHFFSHEPELAASESTTNDDKITIKPTSTATIDVRSKYNGVRLQVNRVDGINQSTIATIAVYPDPRLNTTHITVGCLYFLFGGIYELKIVRNNSEGEIIDIHDERLRKQVDVRWPQPKLSVSSTSIDTYPQHSIDAIIEFPGTECVVPHSQIDNMPEFWLELYYCGHDVYCENTNISAAQVLYAEQVRGYPKARLIKLRCELFGLAGQYMVKLLPVPPVLASVTATAYIKVTNCNYLSNITGNINRIRGM